MPAQLSLGPPVPWGALLLPFLPLILGAGPAGTPGDKTPSLGSSSQSCPLGSRGSFPKQHSNQDKDLKPGSQSTPMGRGQGPVKLVLWEPETSEIK